MECWPCSRWERFRRNEFWPEPPYPAWTAIGVDRLWLDDALIEIRFTAALPPGR